MTRGKRIAGRSLGWLIKYRFQGRLQSFFFFWPRLWDHLGGRLGIHVWVHFYDRLR